VPGAACCAPTEKFAAGKLRITAVYRGDFFLQKRYFRGSPIDEAVARETEHCGGGVAWLEGEIHRHADRADDVRGRVGMRDPVGERSRVHEEADHQVERVGAHPFDAALSPRYARHGREARALHHVESVPGGEQRPKVQIFRNVHERSFRTTEC